MRKHTAFSTFLRLHSAFLGKKTTNFKLNNTAANYLSGLQQTFTVKDKEY